MVRQTVTMPARGPDQPRRGPLVWVVAVVGLVGVAVASLPSGFILRGRTSPRPDPLVVPDPPALAGYLALTLALFLLGVWVSLQVMRFRAARGAPRAAGTPVWLQVAIVVFALLLPALVGEARDLLADRERASPEASTPPSPSGAPRDAERSEALGVAVTALLGVVLAALVAATAWLMWPERSTPRDVADEDAVAAQLDAGIDELERIGDPRAAVIACYAHMERIAARAGVGRRASDTPAELLARVLRSHRAAEDDLRRLTALFERARFSPHRIDEDMRRGALDALRRVRARIAAPA